MSYHVDIRFRPVTPLDGVASDPRAAAVDRWSKLATTQGLVGVTFGTSRRGTPQERPGTERYSGVPPVDVQTEWKSFDDAATFFADKHLWEYLCGVVACAPAANWEGFADADEIPR